MMAGPTPFQTPVQSPFPYRVPRLRLFATCTHPVPTCPLRYAEFTPFPVPLITSIFLELPFDAFTPPHPSTCLSCASAVYVSLSGPSGTTTTDSSTPTPPATARHVPIAPFVPVFAPISISILIVPLLRPPVLGIAFLFPLPQNSHPSWDQTPSSDRRKRRSVARTRLTRQERRWWRRWRKSSI